MLASLIRAPRKRYTVRFVACVALVGVGFLLRVGREWHSENMKKLVLARRSQARTSIATSTALQRHPTAHAVLTAPRGAVSCAGRGPRRPGARVTLSLRV